MATLVTEWTGILDSSSSGPMLLNEFLKEHRKVQQLEKQVEKLTTGLQKVTDDLELSKPAPQTILNNQ